MKNLTLGFAMLAIAFASPLALSAAEGENDGNGKSLAKTTKTACFNTTCPVDGKPVDAAVPTISYTPADKAKNAAAPEAKPEMGLVGFCSLACHDEFETHPAQYSEKLTPQWQLAKQNQVK